MSYELVTGLITLSGFGITVGTVVARLAAVIARLNTTVADFSATIAALKKDNAVDHREIHAALTTHEQRITRLEGRFRDRH